MLSRLTAGNWSVNGEQAETLPLGTVYTRMAVHASPD